MVPILLLISFGWYWSILYAPLIKALCAHLFIGWKWLKDTYFGCCKSQIHFKLQVCDKTSSGCQVQKIYSTICDAALPQPLFQPALSKSKYDAFLITLACLLCPNVLQFSYNLHNLLWFLSSDTKLCWGLSFPVRSALKQKQVMPSCSECRFESSWVNEWDKFLVYFNSLNEVCLVGKQYIKFSMGVKVFFK